MDDSKIGSVSPPCMCYRVIRLSPSKAGKLGPQVKAIDVLRGIQNASSNRMIDGAGEMEGQICSDLTSFFFFFILQFFTRKTNFIKGSKATKLHFLLPSPPSHSGKSVSPLNNGLFFHAAEAPKLTRALSTE